MNCPLLYRFRVIDKLPEPPSADALKGTLVHAILEDLFGLDRLERTPDRAHDLLQPTWEQLKEKTSGVTEMFQNVDLEQWLISAHSLLDRYFELEDPKSFDPTDLEKFDVNISESIVLEDSATGVVSATAAGAYVVAVPHLVPIEPAPRRVILKSLENLTVVELIKQFNR